MYLLIEMSITKEIVLLKKYGPESFHLISIFSPKNIGVNVACWANPQGYVYYPDSESSINKFPEINFPCSYDKDVVAMYI